ncbi:MULTISPECIES: glycerate kinase [unclassified Microbacterium]|uniref:glycerate kinase n=1 Tax=unclassified Microbacterium TaxID=2609290 RepID=UPI0022AC3AE1|nr:MULTISPECIES: glycerate kinase [unclassified Microbacterium]
MIDIASTSGIELLDELRLWDADRTGFGQTILAALEHGISRLVVGIGSSGSTDGDNGMLSALGARFLNAVGKPVARGARGLNDIASVDSTSRISGRRPMCSSSLTSRSPHRTPRCRRSLRFAERAELGCRHHAG